MAVVPCNAGFTELAKLAVGEASDVWIEIALGTGTGQGASSTVLSAELTDSGLDRQAATMTSETTTVTDDTIQGTKVFTATATKTVTEAGLFNSVTAGQGDMLMVGDLSPSAPMVSGDTLTITLKCQIKAAA